MRKLTEEQKARRYSKLAKLESKVSEKLCICHSEIARFSTAIFAHLSKPMRQRIVKRIDCLHREYLKESGLLMRIAMANPYKQQNSQ